MAESSIKNNIDAYAQFEKWLSEQPLLAPRCGLSYISWASN